MNDHTRPTALISGLDESGYGILRALGPAGVPVVAFGGRWQSGRLSRYCRAWRSHAPDSRDHPERILEALLEWRGEFDAAPVLFATSDWFALTLARYRDQLERHFRHHWISEELFLRVADKALLADFCRRAGVLIPRTHATRPGEPIRLAARDFGLPFIVKPTMNFNPHFGMMGLKNVVAHRVEDLEGLYARYPELLGASVWQEIIEGDERNFWKYTGLVTRAGEIPTQVTLQKYTHYPANGLMSLGRTAEDAHVVAQSEKLLRALGYIGFADIEYKYRESDGRLYFIELNPRLPYYNSFFLAAGVNLTLLGYLDLAEEPLSGVRLGPQRNGIYWIHFEKHLRRTVEGKGPLRRRLGTLILDALRARSSPWLCLRDPLPFLAANLRLLKTMVRRLARRGAHH